MNNRYNRFVYWLWAPLYDLVFRPVFVRPRQRLIAGLNLQPGDRLLIPGVGTGLDLPYVPLQVQVCAGDYSSAMLIHALAYTDRPGVSLQMLDAQALPFGDAAFDAVLLNLILSVVPNGTAAFHEAWRVLKPGGRCAVFDKFLDETQRLTTGRRLLGRAMRLAGTDPNRRLHDLLADAPGLVVEGSEPSVFGGLYQLFWLSKQVDGDDD